MSNGTNFRFKVYILNIAYWRPHRYIHALLRIKYLRTRVALLAIGTVVEQAKHDIHMVGYALIVCLLIL